MEETTPPQATSKIQQKTKPIWLWVVIGIALVAILANVIYYLVATTHQSNDNTASDTTDQDITSTELVTDEGVTWLNEPKKITDLGLLTVPADIAPYVGTEAKNEINYFVIGSDDGKDIILAEYILPEPGPSYGIYHFLETGDGQYEYLSGISEKMAEDKTYGYLILSDKVTMNPKEYKSVAYHEKITVKDVEITSAGEYAGWFPDEEAAVEEFDDRQLTKFTDTSYGPVYRLTTTHGQTHYTTETYLLRRPNNTTVRYQLYAPFIKDDYVPSITWDDGTVNTGYYRSDGIAACGLPYGIATLTDTTIEDLVPAGKTNGNEIVYSFKDTNHPLIQTLFTGYNSMGESFTPPKSVTIDQYMKAHAVFVYKDKLDRLVLFNGGEYGPLAECGKPVIYLYPEKTQQVSVKVDADITVSDPEYGNGWTVTAEPNGRLTNSDGKEYDSLFWEGTGQDYPAVTEGFVVARADIEKTLRNHLAQLGLRDREVEDFMEFWLPKMPKTPYTRLTWFGTRQMDRLAPLAVEPKPDTSIRVFLDFEGLQQPVTLPAQRLTAIPRKGFTLIEWGGLLKK